MRPRFLAVALAAPFLVGVIAFLGAAVVAGSASDALPALFEQAGRRRLNPLVAGALGLAPVLLLLLILVVGPRLAPRWGWGPAVAWAGLAPVALLELWAHWTVWSTYFPSRAMPGFPHGLELVIVPLFFAPVGAVVGVVVGLLAGGSRETSDEPSAPSAPKVRR
jgi:hypothetical protein